MRRALRRSCGIPQCSEQRPKSPFVFTWSAGRPSALWVRTHEFSETGSEAKLGFKAHPHMLRHGRVCALANKGQPCRPTSGIAISSTPYGTPSYRRRGFGNSGESEVRREIRRELQVRKRKAREVEALAKSVSNHTRSLGNLRLRLFHAVLPLSR
jgi:hypothetical protein